MKVVIKAVEGLIELVLEGKADNIQKRVDLKDGSWTVHIYKVAGSEIWRIDIREEK